VTLVSTAARGGTTVGSGLALLFDSTLGADAATIDTLATLDGSYKSLMLHLSVRSARAANTSDSMRVRFNADSGNNYSTEFIVGLTAVSAVETFASAGGYIEVPAATAPAAWFSTTTVHIPEYASTSKRKSAVYHSAFPKILSANNAPNELGEFFWDSTTAITRVAIICDNGNVLAGSRMSVYGIG